MDFVAKTAAFGLFSALLTALTATGESDFPVQDRIGTLPAPSLTSSDAVSTTGYHRLSWTLPEYPGHRIVAFELQERLGNAPYKTSYVGLDRSSTLTGLSDGTYRYRVRALLAPSAAGAAPPDTTLTAWSSPVVVVVRHHSLARAIMFLIIGGIVFLATLVLIIRGSRRSNP